MKEGRHGNGNVTQASLSLAKHEESHMYVLVPNIESKSHPSCYAREGPEKRVKRIMNGESRVSYD